MGGSYYQLSVLSTLFRFSVLKFCTINFSVLSTFLYYQLFFTINFSVLSTFLYSQHFSAWPIFLSTLKLIKIYKHWQGLTKVKKSWKSCEKSRKVEKNCGRFIKIWTNWKRDNKKGWEKWEKIQGFDCRTLKFCNFGTFFEKSEKAWCFLSNRILWDWSLQPQDVGNSYSLGFNQVEGLLAVWVTNRQKQLIWNLSMMVSWVKV